MYVSISTISVACKCSFDSDVLLCWHPPTLLQTFNISHTIHHLAFGPPAPSGFPPIATQLDGTVNMVHSGMFAREIKVSLMLILF
jgi:hypothetical protein